MPQDMEKKPQERGERRERGPRRDRRPESEFQEKMVSINRVTKVVKGGRNFRFAALVVIGDGKGRVGCGIGKATEIPEAARKATEDAKKHLVHVSMKGTSIPHETVGRFGTGEIGCGRYRRYRRRPGACCARAVRREGHPHQELRLQQPD